MSVLKNIPFDDVYTDTECVVVYQRDNICGVVPLVVSMKRCGYLVLCGVRRFNALLWLRDKDPSAFNRILPEGIVLCVVYEGLTESEETDFRVFGGLSLIRLN